MSVHQEKKARIIHQKISSLIQKHETNIQGINITRISLTKKLEKAVIYFSILKIAEKKEAEKKLNQLNYFFRKKLAEGLPFRKVPELEFCYDNKSNYIFELNKKISELGK